MRFVDIRANGKTFHTARMALGTFGFGFDRFVSKETAFRLIDQYLEAGGNVLDCARVYLGGICEETVGEYLEMRKNRDRVILSTKGGHPPQNDMSAGRLTLDELKYDLEASMEALHTDYIDYYWLHKDDVTRPVGEIVEAVNALLETGHIGALGCSNWHTDRIEEANLYAAEHGMTGFELSQIQWSLAQANQQAEDYMEHNDVVMTPREYGWYCGQNMLVFAWGSQASAVFNRVAANGWERLPQVLQDKFDLPVNRNCFEKLQAFSAEKGVSITTTALAYVTCNKLPGVALIGCKNQEQLADSLNAADIEFSSAEMDQLRAE